jgi:glycolate oxidase iron-sulfur subunit
MSHPAPVPTAPPSADAAGGERVSALGTAALGAPPEASPAPLRAGAFDYLDPVVWEGILDCVHCGICLPQCPTYRVLEQEMDSPRGRIYLMRAAAEGRIDLTPNFVTHMDRCLGCRACETACPSGVPFGRLLEEVRGQIEMKVPRPLGRRLLGRLILALFPDARRLRALLGLMRGYQRSGLQSVVRRTGVLRSLPRLQAMERLLPALPPTTPDRELREVRPAGTPRGTVALLEGCVQAALFPEVNRATVRLLARAGYRVVIPAGQGCCGALHLHWGAREPARRLAARNVATLVDADWVVTNAAGCGSAMREYGDLVGSDQARALAGRVRDVSELLAEHLPEPRHPLPLAVTYHDPCHLLHGQRVREAPRALLRAVPGLTLVDLPESDLCCGSAGVYNLMEPEIAGRLLERKVERIAGTGAQVVASGNPGCLLQIRAGLAARGLPIRAFHPVELLLHSVEGTRP